MNVLEICKRPSVANYETEELIFVVEQYVKDKTNVDVEVNILKGLNSNHPFFHILYQNELSKLSSAFNDASKHFLEK